MSTRLLKVAIDVEQDIVAIRQRARQIASLTGFDVQDQVRIATAVSEIARNAFRYAGGGTADFTIEGSTPPQSLVIRISDKGLGIPHLQTVLDGQYRSETGMGLGIIGARRLMDRSDIRTAPGKGTEVTLTKVLPTGATLLRNPELVRLGETLAQSAPATPMLEMQEQNRELMRTLDELRERQDDLLRLNRELEDTNRGVVALYAELDERALELRNADEMKSRFLSNMSHEFRTPLNSIRALARLLLDRTDGDLSAEQSKQVTFIRKCAEDLTELVDDLLDLAKIEAGKVDVQPVEFSVPDLFSALRGMLKPLLVTERVQLSFDEDFELPLLFTDEAKVSQILRNFISNALKFTERGEVRISASVSGDTVTFSVADTGIGIAAEDQAMIFEEFTQVRGAHQRKVKGTGLGLPLCRKLAILLGGEVTLTSDPGLGSTFSATLPMRYVPPRAEPHHGAAPVFNESARILVIDDDAAYRYSVTKILTSISSDVLEAADAASGLHAARTGAPALIVLDLGLPDMDGSAVLDRLREDPATCDVPVVISTSRDVTAAERAALMEHASAVLNKRDCETQMLPTVGALLEGSARP